MVKSYWRVHYTNKPQNFIFGFGSIINDESRKATAPEAGDPIPARLSPDFGYRRIWNYRSSAKLTALGLKRSTEGMSINGVIYPVETEDLLKFDQREEGYERIKVPSNMIEAVGWQCLPTHEHTILLYVPREQEHQPNKYYPILQSYLDVVLIGCLKYGLDFTVEFLYSTGGWNQYWLNDRQVGRRPWLFQPKYKDVDTLLASYSETFGLRNSQEQQIDMYPWRKLPVEFSVYFKDVNECENKQKNEKEPAPEVCFI